ncbi:DUF1941-domain-containing protein [Xylariaceae sp. FL0016]|nr:DUF1941-domain-containing protein [Xylariaceae sp. FL0016]
MATEYPSAASPGKQDELDRVFQLLQAQDDTSRFVGLMLVKSILDNSEALRNDQQAVSQLWEAIPPKFLDRLLRTGSKSSSKQQDQSKNMLDLAVAVIHIFANLTPTFAQEKSFYGRIPNLYRALANSPEDTSEHIIGLIAFLVQQSPGIESGGASSLASIDDDGWKSLVTVAPKYPKQVFSILSWAWLYGTTSMDTAKKISMSEQISRSFLLLFNTFRGKVSADLVAFTGTILSALEPELLPTTPKPLGPFVPLVNMIHEMASRKLTEKERAAFANCTAALLRCYPEAAPDVLFTDAREQSRPLAYLFVTMLQVDFCSSVHLLMQKIGSPEYMDMSRRLASELDILTAFVGRLIASVDDDPSDVTNESSRRADLSFSSERLLKLHSDLARTLQDAMEFLRDRWDAFLLQKLETGGPSKALEWKNQNIDVFEDPVVASAVRLLGAWLPEDDGETLREQAAVLMDLLSELYKKNLSPSSRDNRTTELRLPILAALEGILEVPRGLEAFEERDFISTCLYPDIRSLLAAEPSRAGITDYIRGEAVIRVFGQFVEAEGSLSTSWSKAIENTMPLNLSTVDESSPDALTKAQLSFQVDVIAFYASSFKKLHIEKAKSELVAAVEAVATSFRKYGSKIGDEDEEWRAIGERLDDVTSGIRI